MTTNFKKMQLFYVYILKDCGIPFYVGKGTKRRMYVHFNLAKRSTKKSPVLDKIRKMILEGKVVEYEKFIETEDQVLCFEKEIELIKIYGRRNNKTGILLNLTDGGEGTRNYIWTDTHRLNLSNSIKLAISEGRYMPKGGSGHEMNEGTCNKISNTLKEYYQTKEGKKRREEISAQKIGVKISNKRILSDEARKKMSEGGKKGNEILNKNESFKKDHSDKLKAYWASEEGVKRRLLSKKNQAKMSKISKSKISYEEAKNWLIGNKSDIKTKKLWEKYTKEKDFPSFLPKDAFQSYRNKGWISWMDFLSK